MIAATALAKRFGDTAALRDVDLRVPADTVFGLIGPNGSGKTTLVRILTTLLRPDGGVARVGGHDVVEHQARVRRMIGVTGQETAIDLGLTGRQNLEFVAELSQMTRRDARVRAQELLERVGLAGVADRRVRTFSGGMRRRLDLAASLVSRPPVLFLDEPTTGLDPTSRRVLWELIGEQVDDGSTVFLTTQYLEEANQLCDTVAVLHRGRIEAHGTPAALRARIGGQVLEVRPADPAHVGELTSVLEARGLTPQVVGTQLAPKLRAPVDSGVEDVASVAAEIARARIAVDGLALEAPSLDEVFVALTGPARHEEPT